MEQNKQTTLEYIVKITNDLSEMRMSELTQPSEVSGEVMKKVINRITTELIEVTRPLSKGKLEQLMSVKLPSFVYLLEEIVTGNRIHIYRFSKFGKSTINPVTKQLIVPVTYEYMDEVAFPLHEPVDALRVNTSEDELSITVEFSCASGPITHTYKHPSDTVPQFNVYRP